MKSVSKLGLLACSAALVAGGVFMMNRSDAMPKNSAAPQNIAFEQIAYDGTRAPEFPAGLSWFNTDKPLSIKGLRGKIVVLDFWTYGCINCIHIIPDLKKLEAKYPNKLVVIGVHSAKFDTESDPKNLRQAVMRYGLEHPVVSDKGMRIWDEYTVRAWPTTVLIDPDGKVVKTLQGEGNYNELDQTIGLLAGKFRREKKLDETPLKAALEHSKVEKTPLYFPGKIAVAQDVIVSDSSHNRLVVTDKSGKVLETIGSGEVGFSDGNFASAQFFNPQGLFIDGDKIYVADTNNHAIRLVDLKAKTVKTVAGTGKQAPWGATGGVAFQSPLSSPWDVLKNGDSLYIAMAGTHQIWRLDLKTNIVAPFAGSGAEARRDGSLSDAAFAQPSGLATDGDTLFVADSESSCIRAIDISGKTNTVKTLAGGDLFTFGDKDGRGDSVLLQHPLGLAYKDGYLYFADTYNSKIKRLDPKTGEVKTIAGDGLDEPGGIAFEGEALLIADTNSNQVKKLDLESAFIQKFELAGLNVPELGVRTEKVQVTKDGAKILAANQKVALQIAANFPTGFKLNTVAPQRLEITLRNGAKTSKVTAFDTANLKFPLNVSLPAQSAGAGIVKISGVVNYCSSGKGATCKVERVNQEIPFKVSVGGVKSITTALKLP